MPVLWPHEGPPPVLLPILSGLRVDAGVDVTSAVLVGQSPAFFTQPVGMSHVFARRDARALRPIRGLLASAARARDALHRLLVARGEALGANSTHQFIDSLELSPDVFARSEAESLVDVIPLNDPPEPAPNVGTKPAPPDPAILHTRIEGESAWAPADVAGRPLDRSAFPKSGAQLTPAQALVLVERFRKRTETIWTTGEFVTCLEHHVLYGIGQSTSLNEIQRRFIASVCSVSRRRPLPALLWSEFVLANLDTPLRVREAFAASLFTKAKQLSTIRKRAGEAWRRLLDSGKLAHDEGPRILAVANSRTLIEALKGIAEVDDKQISVFVPEMKWRYPTGFLRDHFRKEFEPFRNLTCNPISERNAESLLVDSEIDVVLTGCKLIARSPSGELHVVNSAPCIDLVKKAQNSSALVVVATGMYKIWPDWFYERYHGEIPSIERWNNEPANGLLHGDELTWIFTERGEFKADVFAKVHPPVSFFESTGLHRSSALQIKENTEAFKNKRSARTVKGCKPITPMADEEMAPYRRPLTEEELRERTAWEHDSVPDKCQYAHDYYYRNVVVDDAWYRANEGKWVSLLGTQPPRIMVRDTLAELIVDAQNEWGRGAHLTRRVDHRANRVWKLRPRRIAVLDH